MAEISYPLSYGSFLLILLVLDQRKQWCLELEINYHTFLICLLLIEVSTSTSQYWRFSLLVSSLITNICGKFGGN